MLEEMYVWMLLGAWVRMRPYYGDLEQAGPANASTLHTR
jgi:hypothetical protein